MMKKFALLFAIQHWASHITSNWYKSLIIPLMIMGVVFSCGKKQETSSDFAKSIDKTAEMILGNPDFQAISYGGYRQTSREIQPSVEELKEDMLILSAMGIKLIRTYNVQLPHASNVLKAISELKADREDFEMYVMLGAWINCKNAWTDKEPDHYQESEGNEAEIIRAVELANKYPDIVKIIAVGNEAMVKWATAYHVQPGVILKWVNYLQQLKKEEKLPEDLWVTSSDNFASWGGGGSEYKVEDLNKLIHAVDFISMHTYPMHDTHYNPEFWKIEKQDSLTKKEEKIYAAMERALAYAKSQYQSVRQYIDSLGVEKPIHIGETGWASEDNHLYGEGGSGATDEYKQGIYYQMVRDWTNEEGISCFYFEAFDEPWKDGGNAGGSENHFGLFTVEGQAKYVLWKSVDEGRFEKLSRGGNPIKKTYNGNLDSVKLKAITPPVSSSES